MKISSILHKNYSDRVIVYTYNKSKYKTQKVKLRKDIGSAPLIENV